MFDRLLTMKLSQRAHQNFCSYHKTDLKKNYSVSCFFICATERALTVSWKDHAQRASSFVVFVCHFSCCSIEMVYCLDSVCKEHDCQQNHTACLSNNFSFRQGCLWHRLKRNCAIILLCDSPLHLEKFTLSSCLPFLSCLHALCFVIKI